MKLLVANRGEIAIRIMRAASELGVTTVAIYPEDDAGSLHTGKADEAVVLPGVGTHAYLDKDEIVSAAVATGCDAVHPGYGFLAENAEFARCCADADLTFVGPSIEMLELFGDKAQARAAAIKADVPVIRGIDHAVSLAEAEAFFAQLGAGRAMMIKAISGGGGRGSRMVSAASNLASVYERCRQEAQSAFGDDEVYVEEFMHNARHIEVQILGDLHGGISQLGDRECSVQRRFQKIIEVAPTPDLDAGLRKDIIDAAARFARSVGYSSAGTFEFLLDETGTFAFIEANARLQVEHTVTEEVTGVDIVKAQLRIASGSSLAELGLDENIVPQGHAIQARVCMETVRDDGEIHPTSGTLKAYEVPTGPGIRTDGFGYGGYETSLLYDSLLTKVVAYSPSPDFGKAIARAQRALSEFRIEGVETNIAFLMSILAHDAFFKGAVHTRFVDERMSELLAGMDAQLERISRSGGAAGRGTAGGFAGAQVEDSADPLALFTHDAQVKSEAMVEAVDRALDLGAPMTFTAPVQGRIVGVQVISGETVMQGQALVVIQSLELRHIVRSDRAGSVLALPAALGAPVRRGDPLVVVQGTGEAADVPPRKAPVDLGQSRGDLAELAERQAYLTEEYRAEKIAKRHVKQQRSPQENLADLLDGTFREYGPLVTASSWQKEEWLRETTQADGLLMGIGHVNGDLFTQEHSRVIAVHYDYMVVAGTQGGRGHYKQDRMYVLAKRFRLPIILFSEGGGGRPGISGGEPAAKVDLAIASGLREASGLEPESASVDIAGRGGGGVPIDSYTFTMLPELSGLVPLVGINSGRCFAGNTVLLACCDVIIATENSTIGLGGPAMIEGGGLGIYTPEEVGPMSFQVPNGVVDILVKDDEEAVQIAKKYISYFQGSIENWSAADQRQLRHIIPEDRSEMYDIREVINTLADEASVLEIRRAFGVGIVTAFIRIEGMPLGLIANNPEHLSGAIDSDASDKAARFLQLCDTFDVPVLSLMDCPGIVVGPEHERQALLRKCGRLFVTGANMTTPIFGVVLRKAYGLGVQAMCGGSSMEPFFTVAWPTAEFAPMTIDGSVRLAFGRELDAIEDLDQRQQVYERLVGELVEQARAVNSGGTSYGIDDVIDPSETRDWIAQALRTVPKTPTRVDKKRPNVDTW